MSTRIQGCPACGRLYTEDDYCIDCYHDEDRTDSVELEDVGEFDASELAALRAKAEAYDEARTVVHALVDAFHDYEMDAEHAAPVGHREMMRRAKAFLESSPEHKA